jgi:hypothetical protein
MNCILLLQVVPVAVADNEAALLLMERAKAVKMDARLMGSFANGNIKRLKIEHKLSQRGTNS